MLKNLLTIFLLFIVSTSIAQPNLDSLWNVWNDETMPDSSRLDAIHGFAIEGYLVNQPDSAFYFAQLEYDFAKSKGIKEFMAYAIILQAQIFIKKGETDKAIEYQLKGLEINREAGLKRGIAVSLIHIGNIYIDLNNYPKALEYYNECLEIARDMSDEQIIAAIASSNIGIIHHEQGDYEKSLKYAKQGLEIYEKDNDLHNAANAMINIGSSYQGLKNHKLALEYSLRGLETYRKLGDQAGIALAFKSMSSGYFNLNEYDKALEAANQGMEIYNKLSIPLKTADLQIMTGNIYNKKDERQKAITFCKKGYETAEKIDSKLVLVDACNCLYDAYKALGNDKLALKYYEKKVEFQNSIFNEENIKKLTQLEMQYEFDKKEASALAEQERKDTIAEQELKRQKMMRNGFIGGFTVVLLFAGVFLVQRNRIGKEKERSEELLLNILPEETAQELKDKGHSDAQLIEHVTVLFTDFKGFTAMSEELSPKELVEDLHKCFSAFDLICEKYGIEKIKTIGDAYMAAGGLPSPNTTHAKDVTKAALEMAIIVENGKAMKISKGLRFFEVRIGVHTGPVVAGIVGLKKFQYDIWGDTVNTASRMESSGEVGKVNISEKTFELLKDDSEFTFESRGKIAAKGKGEMEMLFVSLKV
ncbi:MAG: adenylate/guanylate cyclase domain-containing protein [Bacteroidia bacterium]